MITEHSSDSISEGKKSRDITIRRLTTPEEMHCCVGLEQAVWKFSEPDVVPHQMFVVAHRTGGQVVAAFDGDRAIGFVLAVPAFREGRAYIHSHMAAVLPDYQNCGIGRRLKLAQREDALARGIDLIEWTFDPFQLKNARFNITRLGVTVREYVPNFYGQTSSPLHFGIPTDRLFAQWWIREPRVQRILAGEEPRPSATECVSVRANIGEICETDPQSAKRIQSEMKAQFQSLFTRSFVVTDFEIDDQYGRYLLQEP